MSILVGFAENKRVIVQGRHGTGKSTHMSRSPPGSTGRACGLTSIAREPHRSDRQRRHRSPGRQANHRIPRGDSSVAYQRRSHWSSMNMMRAGPTSCSSSSASSNPMDALPSWTRIASSRRIPLFACSPPPTRSDWATRRSLSRNPAVESGPARPLERCRDPRLPLRGRRGGRGSRACAVAR